MTEPAPQPPPAARPPPAQGAASRPGSSGPREFAAFWFEHPGRRLQFFCLLGLLWLAFFGSQWFRIDKELAGARRALGLRAEVAYLPPVDVLRLASLGHQSFLADLLFVRATHYFVQHLVTDSRLPWLDVYLETIWGLDAHNRTTFRWGSQVIKFGQHIDREVTSRANRFARTGIEMFPDDPWLYHEIAFNLRYQMEPKDAEETQYYKDLALKYLEMAYSFPSFQYDPNYLAGQYSRAGRTDDSVAAALVHYADATDEQRQQLRFLLEDRNRKTWAAELAWYDLVHRRDWPYLPPTLALLLGPKRVPAPPLDSHRPDQWLRERPTPAELQKQLGIKRLEPPPAELVPGEAAAEPAAAITPTALPPAAP